MENTVPTQEAPIPAQDKPAIQDNTGIPQGLDLSGLGTTGDALNAFNLDQIQNSDPEKPKDPKPKQELTYDDLVRRSKMLKQNLENFSESGARNVLSGSDNPFYGSRLVQFDAKKFNVDRYLGYGESTFNKVGFSPFVDNERNFNENTSLWDDYGRMSSVFLPLAWEGFASTYRSYGSLFSEGVFATDDETAEEYGRLSSIGYSSRGGLGSFSSNLAMNMAYTVGMGGSVLLEEAAIFATGGLGGGGVARTGMNLKRLGEAMGRGLTAGKALKDVYRGSTQLVKSLSKVDDAKNFWTSIRGGAATFGKGAGTFLNPLARTTDDIYDIYKGSTSVRNLSNFAKLQKTFGSFYRDVRGVNLALAEGKLEGGSAKQEKINELIYKYQQENGKLPTGEDLAKIYEIADQIGYGVTMINMPLIFYTNKITLDSLFNFRGFKTLGKAADDAALYSRGLGFKSGTGFYDAVESSWTKNLIDPFKNPRRYAGKGLNYFKANFTEGLQETLQEVVAKGTSDYYDGIYRDPSLGGFEYGAGKAWNGVTSQFSAEGAEIFFSGFLMGGMMSKATNFFLKDVPGVYYWSKDKIQGTNKLQEYKENKRKEREAAVNGLNELYNNPLKYFSADKESFVNQKHTSDVMALAAANGDAKTFQDAKDLKMFDHVFRALKNGSYENLLESYRELMKLDNKDLADFLQIKEVDKAKDKLQEIISRAEEIKQRYDVIEQQFGNPFDYKKFKEDTPEFKQVAMGFLGYENAKKAAVLSQFSFDRALQRMNSLYTDLVADVPVSKTTNSDYFLLTDANNLTDEIRLLKQEIKTYDESDKEQKKRKKEKEERLELLVDYQNKLESYKQSASNTLKPAENGQYEIQFDDTVNPLKESYKKYLAHLAKVNGSYVFNDKIDESFGKLVDYYALNKEAVYFNNLTNTLLDPVNLQKQSQRIRAKFEELFEQRASIDNEKIAQAQKILEINELIKALTANDIIVDENQLIEFVLNGTVPTKFYDANTRKPLELDSDKLTIANDLFKRFDEIQEKPETKDEAPAAEPKKEEPAAETKEKKEEKETDQKTDLNLDPELNELLLKAYNDYIAEYPEAALTYENFVTSSPKASRIKNNYQASKNKPAASSTGSQPTPQPAATDAKADIESRRQAEIDNLLSDVKKLKEADTKEKAAQAIADATGEVGNNALDKAGIIIGEVQWGKNIIDVAKRLANKIEEIQKPALNKINARYDAELAALENKPGSQPTASAAPASTPKTSSKAAELIDAIDSIKEFPDLQKADGTGVAVDLMNLIASGQATAREIKDLLQKKKAELLANLDISQFEKGDIITLDNGSQAAVVSKTDDEIKVRVFGTSSKELTLLSNEEVKKRVRNVVKGKTVDMTQGEELDVNPNDAAEVKASQDQLEDFKQNAARVKENIDNAAQQAGTDNKQNLNNLLNNIGCKTGS
jgi:hypothetical protein